MKNSATTSHASRACVSATPCPTSRRATKRRPVMRWVMATKRPSSFQPTSIWTYSSLTTAENPLVIERASSADYPTKLVNRETDHSAARWDHYSMRLGVHRRPESPCKLAVFVACQQLARTLYRYLIKEDNLAVLQRIFNYRNLQVVHSVW